MKRKSPYELPTIEIVKLSSVDVVTASNIFGEIGEDGGENDGEWTSY